MQYKHNIVITGGTGLLGSTSQFLNGSIEKLVLWTRNHEANFPSITSKVVNLEDRDCVSKALDEFQPSILIHAAGMTSVEECEKENYKAYLANVLTTKNLARECAKRNIKFIYISTDHVGKDSEFSSEEDISFPINVYAKTKLEGEFEAIKTNSNSLIIRTNFYTWGSNYRKSFLDFIIDNLREKKIIVLFDDVRFNPVSAEYLLSSILKLVDSNAKGIVNLTSDSCITKYDFGLIVARVFELNPDLITRGKLSEAKNLVQRPRNLTLDNSKLKSILKIQNTPSYEEVLQDLASKESHFKQSLRTSITEIPSLKMINYGRQQIDDMDFEAVIASLNSAWLTQGPMVERFENAIAEYTGSKYAVAMANWTCGLHMAVLAAGVKPGDIVITSPLSFVASANCAIYAGATPVFADIDSATLNLDPDKIEGLIEKYGNRVKAIIPVHFAGVPCDMERISFLAKKHNIILIEDAAHALGGKYISGEPIGRNRYSDMVGFSLHPVKNITSGEGGVITTDNEIIYKYLLRLRSHGITKANDRFKNIDMAYTEGEKNSWYYEMQELGYNYRITDIQCALGNSQLKKLNSFINRKLEIALKYDTAFLDLKNASIVQKETRSISGNHLYILRVRFSKLGITRLKLFDIFKEKNINLHVHYIPIYRQPFYNEIFNYQDEFPETEAYYNEAVTLPLFPGMTDHEVTHIIKCVQELIG